MNRHLTYASLIGAALMTTAAFAQSSNEPNQPPPPAAQSQANTPAASTGDFVTQQAKDEFRASKLMGVDVYDADNKKIGAIKEVLMDHDGQAKAAVIGVGGFLGIGEKDIAVPFSTLKWETEARNAPAGNTTANPVTTTGGQPKMESVSPAAVEAHQGYPDKAVLNMSLAQLKAAPDFHFAPNPTEASRNAGTTPQTHSNP